MRLINLRRTACALALISGLPLAAWAGGAQPLFDLSNPSTSPFPSDRFTVRDAGNLTGRRVNLPFPNCATQPSDCLDLNVINTLDGFNLQPRISVPFSAAIDPESVTSRSMFLVRLENVRDDNRRHDMGDPVVGINQVVWDPASLTLHVESDALLEQDTRYLLVVTKDVHDTAGRPISDRAFDQFLQRHDSREDSQKGHANNNDGMGDYRHDLIEALRQARVPFERVAAASVFTTQSATAVMEKIRNQIKSRYPAPVSFNIGTNGERTVFNLSSITGITWNEEVQTKPTFTHNALPLAALNIVPGSIAQIAFGKFLSPNYENNQQFIPSTPTSTGVPAVQSVNTLYFNLFIPSGVEPATGWPVAIFGHGFTDSKQGAPLAVASVLASKGIAVIAINVVGHGGGSLGTLDVQTGPTTKVTMPDGGRGFDQNGDGNIDSTEGVNAATPAYTIIGTRDGLNQTVIDLMQLVRQIQSGISLGSSGHNDLDTQRIYYSGQSFGGIYGVEFMGVEPDVLVGVPNVPGGAITEVARLGSFRFLTGITLVERIPTLFNGPAPSPTNLASFTLFNENMPLRNLPPVINTVPGAMAIQELLDNTAWVNQSANPVAYGPHIRLDPLPNMQPKSIIFQFAKGDETVPNPTASAVVRAGQFTDRTSYFRNDLAYQANNGVPTNPHTFLTNIGIPASVPFAIAAQTQIAVFFASNGQVVVNPYPPFFETPIAGPLPETLNFLP